MPAPNPVRALEVRVGLLVIAGLLAALTAILLSDRISFDRDYTVQIFLQDAGGLREQSPVTLAGLRIGEVAEVKPVRDGPGPIRATVKISSRYPLPTDATVALATSGIFGDSSLAFSVPGIRRGEVDNLPMDGSAQLVAGGGFFDALTGQAKSILAAVDDVLAEDTRKDLKRLVANAADLAGEATALAKAMREQSAALGETMAAVRGAVERLDKTIAAVGPQVESVATRAGATLSSADAAIANLSTQGVATLRAAEAAAGRFGDVAKDAQGGVAAAGRLLERIDALAALVERGHGAIGQLLVNPQLAGDLHRMVLDARDAAKELAEHPSAVVWGVDEEKAVAAKAARERELMRRAMANGFPATAAQIGR